MCGIIAIIHSHDPVIEHLLRGIKELLNRGYDSVGIGTVSTDPEENVPNACYQRGKIQITKELSSSLLKKKLIIDELEKYSSQHENHKIGMAHSRWATHGDISEANAHPHLSMNRTFMIVHNGIITNFKTLKHSLEQQNYEFSSDTDTEVIANLLEKEFHSWLDNEKNQQRVIQENVIQDHVIQSIQNTIKQLEGTYGLVIMYTPDAKNLYAVRHGSPLLVSAGDKCGYVASELRGFCGKVRDYISLESKEIIILSKDNDHESIECKRIPPMNESCTNSFLNCQHYNRAKITIEDSIQNPTNCLMQKTLNHFEHWTYKEIQDQCSTILAACGNGGRLVGDANVMLGGLRDLTITELKKVYNIILLGCGSSHHANQISVKFFQDLCFFPGGVKACDASMFSMRDLSHNLTSKNTTTMYIFSSQSGETRDLYKCLQMLRNIGSSHDQPIMIGCINVIDSMIAREVDYGCYLNAGQEIAVGSTKSFTSQIVVLSLIALYIAQHRWNDQTLTIRKRYITDLRKLQHDVKIVLKKGAYCEETIKRLVTCGTVSKHFENNSGFILGQGPFFLSVAQEAALKMKELCYYHAEAQGASSLKHGPFALLSPSLLVILLIDRDHCDLMENTYRELQTRGSQILCIRPTGTALWNQKKEFCIDLPVNDSYQELLTILPLQLFSYHLALWRDIDPDYPRNLAKVVTVE